MMLQLQSLHATLGDRTVLSDISVTVDAGEFVGLVGPNGSGKSTLLRCIAGTVVPSAGRIIVGELDQAESREAAKALVGYCVDSNALPDELTGRQCLELIAKARATDLAAASALIESLAFGPWLDRYVGEFSAGTRQKLAILIALVGDPPVLLFDESLNGLDPASSVAVKDHLIGLVRNLGRSIVLATHGIDAAAEVFDRLVLLNEGRCVGTWDRQGLAILRGQSSVERALANYLTSKPG